MNELLFPIVGALLVFFGIVPLVTLLSWALLRVVSQRDHPVVTSGSSARLALIVLPTLGPVAWFASAVAHQLEGSDALHSCTVEHAFSSGTCTDVLLFGFLLLGVPVATALRNSSKLAGETEEAHRSEEARKKVDAACRCFAALEPWKQRILVVTNREVPACTQGLWRPRIEVALPFVESLDKEALGCVLLHEVQHLRARDPLAYFLARGALSINPLARLLQADFSRYRLAREVLCDWRAVHAGADRYLLAQTLVSSATFSSRTRKCTGHTCLSGDGISGVRMRVHLLLGELLLRPLPPYRLISRTPLLACGLFLIALPHLLGADVLDTLHRGIESLALYLKTR